MDRIDVLIKRYFDGEIHQVKMRKKAAEQCLAEALGRKEGDKILSLTEEIHSFRYILRKLEGCVSIFELQETVEKMERGP